MTFPYLPTPPSTGRPNQFAAEGDAFFSAIPEWAQGLADYGNAISMGFTGTSATSVAVPTAGASVSLTVQPGKGYAIGMRVLAAATAAPSTQWFFATVTAYNTTTGVLAMTVDFAVGAGTVASWQVTVSQPYVTAPGAGGSTTTSLAMPTIGASVSLTASALRTWAVGDTLQVVSTANPATTRFVGTVTAYNSGTGALTLSVVWARGTGTFASWGIAPTVNDTVLNQWTAINSAASVTLDLTTASYFTRTVNGATSFAFTGAPSGQAFGFTLEVVHTSGVITWPAAVVWPENVAPTLTTGKVHVFVFITDDGGTKWRGAALTNYAS